MSPRPGPDYSAWGKDSRVTQGPVRPIVLRLLARLEADPKTTQVNQTHASVRSSDIDTKRIGPSYTPETLRREVETNMRRILPGCVIKISDASGFMAAERHSFTIAAIAPAKSVKKNTR